MTAIDRETGEIITPEDDAFHVLDPLGRTGTVRPGWIATLSLGSRIKEGEHYRPTVNRDGTFTLHDPDGQAPALKTLLDATAGKSLTIAVTSDRIADFLQQHYVRYSASRIEAFGDQNQIVEIIDAERHTRREVHFAGTEGYDQVRGTCKVATSLYFVIAEWAGQDVRISFPDGFGQYRFRSQGRNSLASIVAKIQEIQALTRGRIAGIPLTMAVAMRELAGPDGVRRKLPVCTLSLKPPETIQLTSRNFGEIVGRAIAEAQSLRMLAPPREESEDDFTEAADDVPDDVPDDEIEAVQTAAIKRDGPIQLGQTIAIHQLVKVLGWPDDAYRAYLENRFRVRTSKELTEGQAADLVETLTDLHMRNTTTAGRPAVSEEPQIATSQPPAPPGEETLRSHWPSQDVPPGDTWGDRASLMKRWGQLWNQARDHKPPLDPSEYVSTSDSDETVRAKIGRLESYLAEAK